MKVVLPLLAILCRLNAWSQTDSLERNHRYEVKVGLSNLGLYAAAEAYVYKNISLELNGTSVIMLNTVQLGPKVSLYNKKNRVWKAGAAASLLNMNYLEYGDVTYGFGVPLEYAGGKVALGAQPLVAMMESNKDGKDRLQFYFVLLSVTYRWRFA